MCGILGVCGVCVEKPVVEECAQKIIHRGPDDFGAFVSEDGWAGLGFTRLAIMDPAHGAQPMFNEEKTVWAVTNGEIYNHQELRQQELNTKHLHSHSDCEIIIPLYETLGDHARDPAKLVMLYNLLRGVFASVIIDLRTGVFVAARDPIGIRAMYFGRSADGNVWFASEAKCLMKHCIHVEPFKPGHFMVGHRGRESEARFHRYYQPPFWDEDFLPSGALDLQKVHDSFTMACVRRLMSDVPVGVFISGGLDSSLVASIAKRNLPENYTFHSFSCGLEGSPDIAAAQRVADFLGTEHHVLTFTVQQGIEALENVIYHLETFDVTTIRASTPMYLLSGLCKQYIKVVLSGEGADEVYGGYLYFHNAPNAKDFHKETVRRVKLLYTADVLRGDRATAAQSLELRVPFLDRDFLDVSMSMDPSEKMCVPGRIEKWIIRQAFSKEFTGEEFLPADILWRQKEQFSDGVGYNWIDGLKAHCEASISDEELKSAPEKFPFEPPQTKEAYYYRAIFERLFGWSEAAQGLREGVHPWVPKWSASLDPSGRAQSVHVAAHSSTPESGL
eukprot:CAMPEP_0184684500 /NCGR_PEP_ID=MMETSP0312-20130426/15532_1 /TAXON_ID=31354 /ORGANISM="Compsopogon coeruleus, Strain SAG 36.94" /LENGTH=558 /DNA_ID=CAMNT_0027137731 /DNA_START=29 /DNA_END=1705 /DNA_ORIENTATION=+